MNFIATPPTASVPRTRPPLAGHDILDTIERALSSAGLNTRSGVMHGVTGTIRQALSSAGLMRHSNAFEVDDIDIHDVEARFVPAEEPEAVLDKQALDIPTIVRPGQFLSRSYSCALGTRQYKLFVPNGFCGQPMPMIVMLHGCKQNPDDFAAGTRMNELAEQLGFLVVYPAQSPNSNGSNCWNWFKADDQTRDGGEPALIAGITRHVALTYLVDQQRIFVAGLSAGGAMAVILGETYPDLYAGVGAHSGLPYAAAQDLPSAFAAMQGNQVPTGLPGLARRSTRKPRAIDAPFVPTIVFHGDRDATVNLSNGSGIVEDSLARSGSGLSKEIRSDLSKGREYTVTAYRDPFGKPIVEQWVVHGAGHAWSGGNALGSYADASGPDASAEMMRFFLAQGGPSDGTLPADR